MRGFNFTTVRLPRSGDERGRLCSLAIARHRSDLRSHLFSARVGALALGIRVHVLLAAQFAELEHDLVGDLTKHERLLGSVLISTEVEWSRYADRDRHEQP